MVLTTVPLPELTSAITFLVFTAMDNDPFFREFFLISYYMGLSFYDMRPLQTSLLGGEFQCSGYEFMEASSDYSVKFRYADDSGKEVEEFGEAEFVTPDSISITSPDISLKTQLERVLADIEFSQDSVQFFPTGFKVLLAKNPAVMVGFVFLGAKLEAWTTEQYTGYLYVKQTFGRKIEVVFEENVGTDNSYTKIENLVNMGCQLIISCSWLHANATYDLALQHPQVKFVLISGIDTTSNVACAFPKFYQDFYLMGYIAAKMTQKNHIGFVAPKRIPEGYRAVNAYALGAWAVNKTLNISVIWSASFNNYGLEVQAALALLGKGVDVCAQNTDSFGAPETFSAQEKFSMGYLRDLRSQAGMGNFVLTSVEVNWGKLFEHFIEELLEGRWQTEWLWEGYKMGSVDLYDYSTMIELDLIVEIQDMQNKFIQERWSSKNFPFVPPLYVNGSELPPESFDDLALYDMNYLLDGIEDIGYIEYTCGPNQIEPQCETCPFGVDPDSNGLKCEYSVYKYALWIRIVLSVVVFLNIISVGAALQFVVCLARNKFLRRAQPLFLVIILIGLFLSYLSIYFLIWMEEDWECSLYPVCVGYSFVLTFGSLFAKTWRIYRIYHNPKLKARKIPKRYLLTFLFFMLLIESLILVLWTSIERPQMELLDDSSTDYLQVKSCSAGGIGFLIFFYGYKIVLLLWGAFISLRVRNVHSDYNETRWIGFAIYTTVFGLLLSGIMWLLRRYPIPYLLLTFTIQQICSTSVLILLFLPKVLKISHNWVVHFSSFVRASVKTDSHKHKRGDGSTVSKTLEVKNKDAAKRALEELRHSSVAEPLLDDDDAVVEMVDVFGGPSGSGGVFTTTVEEEVDDDDDDDLVDYVEDNDDDKATDDKEEKDSFVEVRMSDERRSLGGRTSGGTGSGGSFVLGAHIVDIDERRDSITR